MSNRSMNSFKYIVAVLALGLGSMALEGGSAVCQAKDASTTNSAAPKRLPSLTPQLVEILEARKAAEHAGISDLTPFDTAIEAVLAQMAARAKGGTSTLGGSKNAAEYLTELLKAVKDVKQSFDASSTDSRDEDHEGDLESSPTPEGAAEGAALQKHSPVHHLETMPTRTSKGSFAAPRNTIAKVNAQLAAIRARADSLRKSPGGK
jgi:hypothetical protein